jgi:hypothetical protein
MLVKKRKVFLIPVLALVLSLALIGSASATMGPSFVFDCTGAHGYGWVPAHEAVWWDIALWDPNSGWLYFDGIVKGGDTGAPFDPVVEWPVEIIPGTDRGTSYYWLYMKGCLVQEGHFECPPPPPPGGACTPGYWRNLRKHGDEWVVAGVDPEEDFDAKFGVDLFDPDIQLQEAIHLGGGGDKKLARHGTAAYLNALHPSVDYPLSPEEVIAAIQAGAGDMLANMNEYFMCSLN